MRFLHRSSQGSFAAHTLLIVFTLLTMHSLLVYLIDN